MLDWDGIDTVLLDMDGTLLDLHFDNHFWLSHVPAQFAQKHGIEFELALRELRSKYREVEGSLDWYCVDYWSEKLGLDIVQLKHDLSHKISIKPTVVRFLQALRTRGVDIRLVTNAHKKALGVKMQYTGLSPHFDAIICSHELGVPKEEVGFWRLLNRRNPFDPRRSMLIDDNLEVLRAAQAYGVRHVLAVFQPDSQQPEREITAFRAIRSFAEIMPGP